MPVQKKEIGAFYPGRDVSLINAGRELTVKVFPIGVQHVEQHADKMKAAIVELLPILDGIKKANNGDGLQISDEHLETILISLVRIVRVTLLEFVNEFVDVDVFALSIEHQGIIVREWLEENFFKKTLLQTWSGVLNNVWRVAALSMTISPNSPPPGSTPTDSSTLSSLDSHMQGPLGTNSVVTVVPLAEGQTVSVP